MKEGFTFRFGGFHVNPFTPSDGYAQMGEYADQIANDDYKRLCVMLR